jgi:hypothetical protein
VRILAADNSEVGINLTALKGSKPLSLISMAWTF